MKKELNMYASESLIGVIDWTSKTLGTNDTETIEFLCLRGYTSFNGIRDITEGYRHFKAAHGGMK